MRILKNVKRMIATVLSVTTCLTPGLGVSAAGGSNKAITIQTGPLDKNQLPNQLPLVYNDDYFDKSAFEYNESLATASLALELSGFADTSNYNNQAKNVKKALGELDFKDIQENDGYQQKSEADSIGVVAANKNITSNGEDYTLIPVVIRGGGYENEWGGNAKVGKLGDHEGFDTAATKAKEFVDNYIKEKKIKGKVKLWIVGYSRGGATAGLLGVKFNRDFISTLNELNDELNKDSKNPSDQEYYNSYAEKERARTSKKYKSEIEMNPNDLYVYTFEAPMGMNIANGSGLYEYKGDIPYSRSKKSDQAIYENIHNTINDDDFVTKVAPRIWGFARPGVDHKLLEGRRDNDVKNTEEVLNSFLVNQAYPGSIKYVGNTLVKKSQSWKKKIVNWKGTMTDFLAGIEDFSALSDGIVGMFERALNRARKWDDPKYEKMDTRQYYADRYQATISKLAVAIMGNFDKANSVKSDILKNNSKDIEDIKRALQYNINDFDKPFTKLINKFSEKMNVTFDDQERKNIINLIKGADQFAESPLLLYIVLHEPAVFEMHAPEVHLATLISKDEKNKKLYDAQIKNINAANAEQIQNAKAKENILKEFVDIEKDDIEEEDEKKVEKKDEKKDFLEGVVNIEKDDIEKEDFLGFVDVKKDMYDQGITEYGWNRALAFKAEMDKLRQAQSKNIFMRTLGKFGKGIKVVWRTGDTVVNKTINGGKTVVNGLYDGGKTVVNKTINGGKTVVNGLYDGGKTVVKSLYDGAKYGFQLIGFGSKNNNKNE